MRARSESKRAIEQENFHPIAHTVLEDQLGEVDADGVPAVLHHVKLEVAPQDAPFNLLLLVANKFCPIVRVSVTQCERMGIHASAHTNV